RSTATRISPTATSSSRSRSTSRRSTVTTWSPSAREPWASCARSSPARRPPRTPSCATGSALLLSRQLLERCVHGEREVGLRLAAHVRARAAAGPAEELPALASRSAQRELVAGNQDVLARPRHAHDRALTAHALLERDRPRAERGRRRRRRVELKHTRPFA